MCIRILLGPQKTCRQITKQNMLSPSMAAAHVSGSATLAAARRLGNVRLPPLCRCLEGGGGLLCTYTYGFVRRGLTGRLRGPYNQCVLSVTFCLSIRTSKKESSDFRFQISDFRIIQNSGGG